MTYQVSLEKFSGPLDLLLSIIEEKKLAISEISLSQVADQFLEYLKKLSARGGSALGGENTPELNETMKSSSEYQRILADFLVVASRLILIKSRSLLPNLVLSDEEEGDIKDLEERLKIYQKFRALGRELGHFAKDRAPYFSREYFLNLPLVYGEQGRTIFYPPKNISSEELFKIYEAFIKTLPQALKLEEQSLARVMSIEEKLKELTERISVAIETSFTDISLGVKAKIDVILTFLAMLMLFRNRILDISQDKLFGDIKIKKLD
ncbi:MAG TPA: segregation/condensation protein A [Candidatus Paceibacterota bacterium]